MYGKSQKITGLYYSLKKDISYVLNGYFRPVDIVQGLPRGIAHSGSGVGALIRQMSVHEKQVYVDVPVLIFEMVESDRGYHLALVGKVDGEEHRRPVGMYATPGSMMEFVGLLASRCTRSHAVRLSITGRSGQISLRTLSPIRVEVNRERQVMDITLSLGRYALIPTTDTLDRLVLESDLCTEVQGLQEITLVMGETLSFGEVPAGLEQSLLPPGLLFGEE